MENIVIFKNTNQVCFVNVKKLNFNDLKKKVSEAFQIEDFCISYLNDSNVNVELSSDDDLEPLTNESVLYAYVVIRKEEPEINQEEQEEEQEEEEVKEEEQQQEEVKEEQKKVVHRAYCDNCKKIINGIRYKCMNCYDYDLCEECEAKNITDNIHTSTHAFIKLYKPVDRYVHVPVPPFYHDDDDEESNKNHPVGFHPGCQRRRRNCWRKHHKNQEKNNNNENEENENNEIPHWKIRCQKRRKMMKEKIESYESRVSSLEERLKTLEGSRNQKEVERIDTVCERLSKKLEKLQEKKQILQNSQ